MGRSARLLVLAAALLLAAAFAYLNGSSRISLNFGVVQFYRVPLVPTLFLAFLMGMVTMFGLGLRHDLRVRRALRENGLEDPARDRWPPDYHDDYPR